MGDFINKFDELLSKKGFTEQMLEQYNQSAAAQFDNLQSNIKTSLAQSGEDALEASNRNFICKFYSSLIYCIISKHKCHYFCY